MITSPNDPTVYGYPHFPDTQAAVLLVDKPTGLSSFSVIRRLRRILGVRKIGHAGTLDPLATGMLICLVGKATKRMESFMGMDKVYTGVIRLGQTTASYDAETPVEVEVDAGAVTEEQLEAARRHFLGRQEQLPPMYSAVKVGGERLYRKARRGEEVQRKPRAIEISRFTLGARVGNDLPFEVACTKGTYIRTLAHDFGALLGVGGHLTALRRTAIGPYTVDAAWTLEALAEAAEARSEEPAP
ncbi:MAG: tRNA pseudouridine(55) synthase TruB [Rhodothermales bacterium]